MSDTLPLPSLSGTRFQPRPDVVCEGLSALDCLADLEQLQGQVDAFLSTLPLEGEFEVWWRRTRQRGLWADEKRQHAMNGHPADQTLILAYRDGCCGEAWVMPHESWVQAAERALASLKPFERPEEPPEDYHVEPCTFDCDLNDELSSGRRMSHVASAFFDNLCHEAERTEGLQKFDGYLCYSVRETVIGRREGVVSALHGELRARVELNRCFGESCHVVRAPDSLLPTAMLAARTWRNLPKMRELPELLNKWTSMPVVLHPRLLERLIRRLLPRCMQFARETCPIAPGDLFHFSKNLTIIEDPWRDFMVNSQAFDDRGMPLERSLLVVGGRPVQCVEPLKACWRRRAAVAELMAHKPLQPALEVGYGPLFIEPGELQISELINAFDGAFVLFEVSDIAVSSDDPGMFQATVRWGQMTENGEVWCLPSGRVRLRGSLLNLGEGTSILGNIILGRELFDTGTAQLPYGLCCLEFCQIGG